MNAPLPAPTPILLRGRRISLALRIPAAESRHPLERFPMLRRAGRPFNFSLSREILDPLLLDWSGRDPTVAGWAAAIRNDFEKASSSARLAFAEILPAAAAAGEPAVVAALGVTANLQRTLGAVAEALLDRAARPATIERRLSRGWCGFVGPGGSAPKFHFSRQDLRALCLALSFPRDSILLRCGNALDRLRREIEADGVLSGK